jgi:hypothetical protein
MPRFATLREKEAEEQTVFIVSRRSNAQSTLNVLRSVQSLKLYGRTASALFAEYTTRCTCKESIRLRKRHSELVVVSCESSIRGLHTTREMRLTL